MLIGRKSEQKILKDALNSTKAELIVIYGRRRVGKTFLVRKTYKKYIKFEFSGMYNASLKMQLKNFHLKLSEKKGNFYKPESWTDAFHQLGKYIDTLKSKKKVIFIDEFPWLDTAKSNFLSAFDYFWNNYASKKNNLKIVVCGSSASYMVQKIINNKGGLHNRMTEIIQLLPFNLYETELFLKKHKIDFTRYDIVRLYMVTGGVPFYLEKIKPNESLAQIIDRLCFSRNGFLRNEFKNIFASLFKYHENHSEIVRILAKIRKGLTRNDILEKSKLKSGGTLTKTLTELELSGFIEKYLPYKGKKDALYRLTDEYSAFYLKFIENSKPGKSGYWLKIHGKQSYKIWSGFAFETICIKHIDQIKKGLNISGIHTEQGSWVEKNNKQGAQIDLLIDRDDNVINICEIKFYDTYFAINKKYADEIRNKINVFKSITETRKNIFVTMITSYGIRHNKYSHQLTVNELNIDNLFDETQNL